MSVPVVRPLAEADLPEADRINRIAFGTFFGLADPSKFRGDGDVVHARWRANPDGAFAVDLDGRLVACGFVMDWGSAGILGPLTVDVEFWSRGIARAAMEEMIAYMDRRGFALQGLFTHPQSAKHIRLYESFGFEMQRVTGVMEKSAPADAILGNVLLFSGLTEPERDEALAEAREVASAVFPGLDLTREILSIAREGIGDTLLLRCGGRIGGFACCHQGAMSEAGSGQALVKFASVVPGPEAAAAFATLVGACEGFAASRGVTRLVAGTNTGRSDCYRLMRELGFRTWMNGVAMFRRGGDGYNRAGIYAVDDWR
jgi:GNAT superfamily N-acetyltransferase